ncbi:MAG: PLP-dependent aminotransferase family protein [Roseibium sp.]|uniref:aminotransferase-like domain-containing protein n=1 Tax=Roseibium sp. TaxID=1936156 RepID=UPI002616A24F|nr:PLP-dependent aminotransferase family protein [Roseibium sp.]MCV0427899.1 PLP-dependent aminotransferase family protein [Roseibium sp.]
MAIWLPDLEGRSGPKYLQIVEAMAEDVASGRLATGTQLPPHRELAYQLDVSANTTSRAYAEAVRRALLRGEVGRGTFVRSIDDSVPHEKPNTLHRPQTGPVDLSRNLPFPGFAEPHVRRILNEISGGSGLHSLLDYQAEAELEAHTNAGLKWLEKCGVEARREEIVATMGAQHGLLCVLTSILSPGDLLLTEQLTYTPICAIAERLGLHTRQVDMDTAGVIPDSFEEQCRTSKPRAFYLTPTLQAPTTVTLSDTRRQSIAEIANRYGVIIIEDDVFGPLKTDRPETIAMRAPDHTVYVTSLSKAVAPGLRVGFLRAPERLMPGVRQAINLSVWMTPPLMLEVAARLIVDGLAGELATRQRTLAAKRQALARSILGDVEFASDINGLHIWLPLFNDLRADVFRAQCAQQGVLVSEARSFSAQPDGVPEAIRICLSHEPNEMRLKQALQKVADLIKAPSSSYMLSI